MQSARIKKITSSEENVAWNDESLVIRELVADGFFPGDAERKHFVRAWHIIRLEHIVVISRNSHIFVNFAEYERHNKW